MTLFLLYGVLLYIVSCIGRNLPSLVDYGRVWNAAVELSEGRELSEAYYFKIYGNNIKPMLYLSILFRIAGFLHISDPFYFVLCFGVAGVLAAVWGAGILAGASREEREDIRIPILVLFICTLPIWGNVQTAYTDGMSFAVGITVLALMKLCFESGSRRKRGACILLAGILLGVGVSVKVTVLIPIIAGLIVFCFLGPSRRMWGALALFLLCSIAAYGATTLWAENYEIWRSAQETAEPIVDWIALGMKGDGSYGANLEFIEYAVKLPTKQEKTEYALHYIWENRSDFFDLTHLVQKLRHNFAEGNLGASVYAFRAWEENNPLWEMFSAIGKYYWRTSQICFSYLFSIYVCYLLGAVLSFCRLLRKEYVPAAKALADLALMGNVIFLMIWEAENRQLYNQTPVILLGGALNILYLMEFFAKRQKNRRMQAGEAERRAAV